MGGFTEKYDQEYEPDTRLVSDCKKIWLIEGKEENQYLVQGGVHLSEGKYDLAIENYTLALDIAPDSYVAFFQRGVAYKKAGDFVSAINDYKKAQKVNPRITIKDGCLFDNIANAYHQLGDFKIAISYHDKALKLSPNNPFIINNRGLTIMEMKNYDGAVKDFHRSLELLPEGNPALLNIGTALSLNGRYKESIKYFDQAIQKYQMPKHYALRGLTYVDLGDIDKACSDLIYALKNGETKATDFVDSYCR